MRRLRVGLLTALVLSLACHGIAAAQDEAPSGRDTTSWALANAVELRELRALDAVIGKARVIGLAEYAHQQPECLELRNRLFEYLVKSHGVTAIAAETSFIKGIPADDYVLGRATGKPGQEAVHGMFSWSPHVADENRQLLEWMRRYNEASPSARKLRFYGIDLTGYRPSADIYEHARESADRALAYATRFEPRIAGALLRRLESGLARFTRSAYAKLSPAERDALTGALRDLSSLFEQRRPLWAGQTSTLEYERAYRSVQVSLQHDADFRASAQSAEPNSLREAAMAANLRWVLEQEGPAGRVLLFASFDHLTRGPNPDFHGQQLGAQLATMLGEDYVAMGSYWLRDRAELTRPGDAGVLADELLRPVAERLPHPLSFLDMRARPADERWLTGQGTRASFFDAVVFLRVNGKPPQW